MNWLYEEFWDIKILNWLLFLLFAACGLLLKRYISYFFTKVLYRIVSRLFSEYSAQQFKELLTRPVSGFLATSFFFMAILQLLPKLDTVVIIPAFKKSLTKPAEMTNAVSLFDTLQHILYIGFVFYGFLLLNKIIEYILNLRYQKAFGENDKGAQQVVPLVKDIVWVAIWALAIIVGLAVIFHFDITTVFAGLGIGGIAIAFAAKESLENLIASFMVLVDKPFTIGDWIKIGNTEGVIEKIGFRSSKLRTFDKSIIIIPNRKLIDSEVENFSLRGIRRSMLVVGGIYGVSRENLELAMKEIREGLEKIEGVNENVKMWFDGFGDSQLDLKILYFVDVNEEIDFFNVKHLANFIIYETMYKYCQGFAFPTQTEYIGDEINEVVK